MGSYKWKSNLEEVYTTSTTVLAKGAPGELQTLTVKLFSGASCTVTVGPVSQITNRQTQPAVEAVGKVSK